MLEYHVEEMETQDSLDIAKLQRVALGLVCNDLQRPGFSLG